MKGRSALPRAAFLVGLFILVAGLVGATWGRRLMTRVPVFKVRKIEVVGTRWLAPDSVLHSAAIDREASVWQDFAPVQASLEKHPIIDEARVHRVGLNSVRIVIREVEPLALVGVPELRPVRADGTILPIDPWQTSLDLPIVTAPAQVEAMRLKSGRALKALEIFAALRELDPGLAAIISDFDLAGSEGLEANLLVSQPARRLALPGDLDETVVGRVRATLADLRARGIEASLVEARYVGQVVVRVEQSSREAGRQL